MEEIKNSATLIISSPEVDSNLYYACGFMAPDPIIYFEIDSKKYLVLSDLEIDRAKATAKVDHVLSLSDTQKKIDKKLLAKGMHGYALVVHTLFKQKGIKKITVPSAFPSSYYKSLLELGYKVEIKADPFYEGRLCKTESEKKSIRHAIHQVEKALLKALTVLQQSKILGSKIYHGKELVTSQFLKSIVNTTLMELGCTANHTIISSGVQGSLPHDEGSGAIKPHTPIIFDIFPRHNESRYFADMTRTVVKGKPSETVKKMFKAVIEANNAASALVREGTSAAKVHEAAAECLKKYEFKTGFMDGRMQGYIHSTGHGLGLDIHEFPFVSSRGPILKAGNVITIEPGLYYAKHGGIRIEDDLFVTKTGYERLTKFPKFLELDETELPKTI